MRENAEKITFWQDNTLFASMFFEIVLGKDPE